jgi:hypothetical protein
MSDANNEQTNDHTTEHAESTAADRHDHGGKERGQNPTEPDISAIMSPVAHSLTRPQVEAIAAYLSYLK